MADTVENILDAISDARRAALEKKASLSALLNKSSECGDRQAVGAISTEINQQMAVIVAIGCLLDKCQGIADAELTQ